MDLKLWPSNSIKEFVLNSQFMTNLLYLRTLSATTFILRSKIAYKKRPTLVTKSRTKQIDNHTQTTTWTSLTRNEAPNDHYNSYHRFFSRTYMCHFKRKTTQPGVWFFIKIVSLWIPGSSCILLENRQKALKDNVQASAVLLSKGNDQPEISSNFDWSKLQSTAQLVLGQMPGLGTHSNSSQSISLPILRYVSTRNLLYKNEKIQMKKKT